MSHDMRTGKKLEQAPSSCLSRKGRREDWKFEAGEGARMKGGFYQRELTGRIRRRREQH